MELAAATSSVLSAIESLLIVLDDRVQERLFRTEQRQPGSISRSLLRTQGRLTSKLPHLADQHLKVMMLGPVANTLERRINEMVAPEVGVLPLIKRRLLDDADSLRVAALGAKSRVAILADRARTLQSDKSQLLSSHTSLMSRLSGDAVLDQQIRREITSAEDGLSRIHLGEREIEAAISHEVAALRQVLDAAAQLLGSFVRLGLASRVSKTFNQRATLAQIKDMSIGDLARWWSELSEADKKVFDEKYRETLRNLNGMPIDYRIKANRIFLEGEAKSNPKVRKALEAEGLLDVDGNLTSKVVLFDTSNGESFGESITAHGNCANYNNINLHYEGTGAGPGGDGTQLRGSYDNMDFRKHGGNKTCTTTFVMRNTKNAKWPGLKIQPTLGIPPWSIGVTNAEKNPLTAYGVDYNADGGAAFVEGLRAHTPHTLLHITGHSHGARTAAELACRTGASALHLQDPAPHAFGHLRGDCVKHIYVYRDLDSSDADAKILDEGNSGSQILNFWEGLTENYVPEISGIGFLLDDNKTSKALAMYSSVEQALFQKDNPGVKVSTIESGKDGVVGGQRDSLLDQNQGSSHSAFTYAFWRREHRNQIAIHNAQVSAT